MADVFFNNGRWWLWVPAFAGTTRGKGSLNFSCRRHRRRRAHPLDADRCSGVGVGERIRKRFSPRELRRDRADKAIAGAGGVDGTDGTTGNDQWFAVDQRQHAALAESHADDVFLAGPQGPHGLKQSRMIVAIAKLGLGEKAELGFIEDENIDKIE